MKILWFLFPSFFVFTDCMSNIRRSLTLFLPGSLCLDVSRRSAALSNVSRSI